MHDIYMNRGFKVIINRQKDNGVIILIVGDHNKKYKFSIRGNEFARNHSDRGRAIRGAFNIRW